MVPAGRFAHSQRGQAARHILTGNQRDAAVGGRERDRTVWVAVLICSSRLRKNSVNRLARTIEYGRPEARSSRSVSPLVYA